jgi:hypothetical protein
MESNEMMSADAKRFATAKSLAEALEIDAEGKDVETLLNEVEEKLQELKNQSEDGIADRPAEAA